jgi:hypothetical protein
VHLGDYDSLNGRVGLRLVDHWGEEARVQSTGEVAEANSTWLRLNLRHEFLGDNETGFETTTGPLQAKSSLRGSAGEVELGLSARLGSRTSGQISVAYQRGLGGAKSESFTGSTAANTGGRVGTGLGLSTQLSKATSVGARLDYGRGSESARDGVTAQVGLNSLW